MRLWKKELSKTCAKWREPPIVIVLWAQGRMEMQKDGNNIGSFSSTAKCTPFVASESPHNTVRCHPSYLFCRRGFWTKNPWSWDFSPASASVYTALRYRNLEWALRSSDTCWYSECSACVQLHSWHACLADLANRSYCSFLGVLEENLESFLK